MKNIVTLFLIICTNYFTFSTSSLKGSIWVNSLNEMLAHLEFINETEIRFYTEAYGGFEQKGKYSLTGDTIKITTIDSDMIGMGTKKVLEIVFTLVNVKDSLFYTRALITKNNNILKGYQKMYDFNSTVKPGKVISQKDFKVLRIKNTTGKPLYKLNVRSKPNLKGSRYIMSEHDEDTFILQLEPGSKYQFIARTLEKSKVNEIEEYWYFITISIGEYTSIKLESGNRTEYDGFWVFGGYIKFDK